MQKIKKILIILFFMCIIPISVIAFESDDEFEELDYVWLENQIKEAKGKNEINIMSKNAVAYDRSSKTVIWGKNEQEEVPMASTTKIMTAVILLENISNLNEKIKVSKEAANIGGSRLGLKTGDEICYNDLLYGLMLCSGNDAAVQIAISIGGSVENFANLMNKKSKELGLVYTNFVTPHGLDNSNHYTTAIELAIMADYALNIEKFAKVVSTSKYTVMINNYPKTIRNTNELLGYLNGVNGVKTGFTNGAGRCLVTSVSRDNFDIITVVLGAETKKMRTKDSINIIEYVYNNYNLVDIESVITNNFEKWKEINEKRIKVYKGIFENVTTEIGRVKFKKYPVLKDEEKNIFVDISTCLKIEAPIKAKTKIGELRILLNTKEVIKVDIFIKEEIKRKKYIEYFKELLVMYRSY